MENSPKGQNEEERAPEPKAAENAGLEPDAEAQPTQEEQKRENPWLNIGLNIVLPTLVLVKGGDWFGWGSLTVFLVGLSFPLGYGVFDLIVRRKYNVFSVIGFLSVLLTGGINLLELPSAYLKWKEAAVPLVIGGFVLATAKSKKPLIKLLLFNPEIFNVPLIDRRLEERGKKPDFEKLMRACTIWVAASFLISAILNYILAEIFIKSPTGTEAFNKEYGKMMGASYVAIVIPSMAVMLVALVKLTKGIGRLTELEMEDWLHPALAEKQREAEKPAGEEADKADLEEEKDG